MDHVGAQRSAVRTQGSTSNAHDRCQNASSGHKIATDASMRSNSGVRQVCAAIARRGVRPSFRSVRPGYVRVRSARREE